MNPTEKPPGSPEQGTSPESPEKITFENIGVNQGETIEFSTPGMPEDIERTKLLRPADKTERAELQKQHGVDADTYFVATKRGIQKPEEEQWGFFTALDLKASIERRKNEGKEIDVIEPSAKEQKDLQRWQESTKLRQQADAIDPKNISQFDQREELYRRATPAEPPAPNSVENNKRKDRTERHRAVRAIEFYGQVDQQEPNLSDDKLRQWRSRLGNARKDLVLQELRQDTTLSEAERQEKRGKGFAEVDAELQPKFLQQDYTRMQKKLAEVKQKGSSLLTFAY